MKVTTTKYASALFLTAILSIASSQAVPQTTQAADPTLAAANITIETGKYQGPLSSLLGAIAKGAGYELVLEVNVDKLSADEGEGATPVAFSFQNKPFNEVWPLLMDIYDLNYTVTNLGDQPVIRVNKEAVQEVVTLETVDAEYAVQRAKIFFGSPVEQTDKAKAAEADSSANTQSALRYEFDSPTLRVVTDSMVNRLIIRGSNAEVQEVAAFVRNLDVTATQQRQQQLAQYGEEFEQVREEIYRSNGNPEQIAAFITAQYPALTVRQLPNNTGLLLRGDTNVINSALALLAKTDPAADGTVQEIFQLVNANARDVASTLTNTLARDLATSITSVETPSNNTGGDTTIKFDDSLIDMVQREVTIIPDERTNSLIVRGTTTQVAQVAALIPTLDQRVPQINLQVRIQELNEVATRSLGVDWRASVGGFQVALAGDKGLTASFNPLSSSIGFNVFPVLNALERQNLAKRVYDASVTMQSGQRKLEAAGSRNQNAAENAAASLHSGGRLEISMPSGDTTIQKTIPYGVELNFFDPVVAPDGTITVRVQGKVSSLANESDIDKAIAEGIPPYLLRFLESQAQTKISFKPGETVLLTGLSKVDETSTRNGLPFSTDIPLLGALTGTQGSNTNNSDLLFVITGNIIE